MEGTDAGRAVHPVTLSREGTLVPDFWSLNAGDIVEITSDEAEAVLCVSDTSVFGSARFVIPRGQALKIVVQKFSVDIFIVVTHMGSLSARCIPTGDGGDGRGGGSVAGTNTS